MCNNLNVFKKRTTLTVFRFLTIDLYTYVYKCNCIHNLKTIANVFHKFRIVPMLYTKMHLRSVNCDTEIIYSVYFTILALTECLKQYNTKPNSAIAAVCLY